MLSQSLRFWPARQASEWAKIAQGAIPPEFASAQSDVPEEPVPTRAAPDAAPP